MSLQYKTFYSDAACSVPIRVSFPPGSCENIRLDTSCRQDSGYFSRSSCTTSDGLAALATELFGKVPVMQHFNSTQCSRIEPSLSYSFMYPLNKCIPNIENSTITFVSTPPIQNTTFAYEMIKGDYVLQGFQDSGCQIKVPAVGLYLGEELTLVRCHNYTILNRGTPLYAVDTNYDNNSCTVALSTVVYPLDSCVPTSDLISVNDPKISPEPFYACAPSVRKCTYDPTWTFKLNSGVAVRHGSCDETPGFITNTGFIANITSMFGTVFDKCVPARTNGTYSIARQSTLANATKVVTIDLFGNAACNGSVTKTEIYQVAVKGAFGPCFDSTQAELKVKSSAVSFEGLVAIAVAILLYVF
ncbi:hypothetical protein BDR26DRAFT_1013462 [Obelidium mucronatum]|nr:hypothetical protein BDR26DRAFT_1013462 [Obelidium mucronatum]